MTDEQVRGFLYNPANVLNCKDCPMNEDFSSWPGTRLKCGQFRCWVSAHCADDEIEDLKEERRK